MKLLFTPKMQMFLFLSLIAATALFRFPSKETVLTIIVAFLSAATADFVLQKIRKLKGIPPGAAGVSGLIIGLLTSPTLPLYVPAITGVIAMVSKHFLRISKRHVFNPAAFGLFIQSLLFGIPVSWWAVSWQQFSNPFSSLAFVILLTPMLVSIMRMKKWPAMLSFLVVWVTLSVFSLGRIPPLQSLVVGTVLNPTFVFFSLVMLPEPKTSPIRRNHQFLYGALVAILSGVSSTFWEIDPFITSLLIANILFSFKR